MSWLIPVVVTLPFMGYLTGWLVGSSKTPVVGIVLPFLFGLIGAITINSIRESIKGESYYNELMKIGEVKNLSQDLKEKIRIL